MTAMDAGRRRRKLKVKGKKKRRADVLHWLVASTGEADWALSPLRLAKLATDAV
ncbi:hypothetical protein ACLK19_05720 [Escherichia coli]